MEIVVFWETLIIKTKKLGNARKNGDKDLIEKAKAEHDEYRDLCLKADRMILGIDKSIF